MKDTAGVIIDPKLHSGDTPDPLRTRKNQTSHCLPVIQKHRDQSSSLIIKHISKAEVKKNFIMFDHITQQNSPLIHQLNKDQKIQSAK